MKKPTILKQLFFAGILIAGMNIYSSCNSCSRETKHKTIDPNGYDYAVDENLDSIDSTDYNGATVNDGNSSSTSIGAVPSGNSNTGKTTSTTKPVTTSTTPTPNKNTANTTTQQEITNKIENSDYGRVYDKDGKPMRDSGASGSGMGTGTGSTGNNSRVTTREAQKN